jgi:hypothetical protein
MQFHRVDLVEHPSVDVLEALNLLTRPAILESIVVL